MPKTTQQLNTLTQFISCPSGEFIPVFGEAGFQELNARYFTENIHEDFDTVMQKFVGTYIDLLGWINNGKKLPTELVGDRHLLAEIIFSEHAIPLMQAAASNGYEQRVLLELILLLNKIAPNGLKPHYVIETWGTLYNQSLPEL